MTREELTATLDAHYQAHRSIAPQDVYKLLYQAVFGPEHSVTHWRVATENLYLEILHLSEPLHAVPLLEPLSPGLCRVNLQPYKAKGMSVQLLWTMWQQTVREYQPGTLEDLERYWKFFLVTPWAATYPAELLEQFWQRMATAAFQPVHHSRVYAEANQPHYRVVWRAVAEQKLLSPGK
jgi:hypothetical protein